MRPRMLTIEGLRSFRSRVQIDFGDRNLIAIVGDTGVGKSSILEAITYALYGGATWTAHHGDLISDTSDDMLVELSFDANGKKYTVRRTGSAADRGSTAQLVCHSDGTAIDDVRPVNEAVSKLVGLDRDAFLKTVILPQGKFAELLQAAPHERNEVLKNIFRVDALETVRQHAKTIHDRLWPQVEGLKQRRALLPDDPAGALKAAREAAKSTARVADELKKLRHEAQGQDEKYRQAHAAAESARQLTKRLTAENPAQFIQQLAALGRLRERLAKQRDRQAKHHERARSELDGLLEQRREMTSDGLDIAQLAGAQATLRQIAAELPGLASTLEQVRADRKAVGRQSARLLMLAKDAEHATKAAVNAENKVARATVARQAGEQAQSKAQALLADARRAQQAAVDAARAVEVAERKRAKARSRQEKAKAALKKAAERHRKTSEALKKLERRHAAAHAAQDVRPGDPCPICTRKLPYDFTAPTAPRLDDAKAQVDVSNGDLINTRGEAAKAEQAIAEATGQVKDVESELRRRKRQMDKAAGQLAAELRVNAVDLHKSDEALLAGPIEALEVTTAAEAELVNEQQRAANAARDAAEAERHLAMQIDAENKRIKGMERDLRQRLRRAGASADSLPDPLRPDLPDHERVETVELDSLNPDPVIELARAAHQRLGDLNDLDKRVGKARGALEQARTGLEQLDDHITTEVTQPTGEIRTELRRLLERLWEAAHQLGIHITDVELSAHALEEAAEALAERRRNLLQAATEAANEQDNSAADAEKKLAKVFAQAEVGDLESLNEKALGLEVESRTALAELKSAREDSALAKRLDERLGAAGQLADDLKRLMDLLTNREFMGDLLARRSRALLAVAGQRLDEMTGGRYAFTVDFRILDQLTGQPRHVRTLSGGESFLASLALALGMVDLAARAGGRLEALFLDEGFGALDASNLDAAVGVLEATARAGRMVAVISHVTAIADRIPEVMVVAGKTDGSRAFWLDDPERAGLSEDDAAAAVAALVE